MATKRHLPYFEITDGGDIVRVEVIGTTASPSIDHRDKPWLETTVTVKGSSFRGQYSAEFMPIDFYKFRQQLVSLKYHLDQNAAFEGTEGYLRILFNIEHDGYTEIKVEACDVPGIGAILGFGMSLELSYLQRLIDQLDEVLKHYPVT
jgi:hypothetical protein